MTGLAPCDHRVGGLVAVVLVVEVDQKCADLRAQVAIVVASANFPGARFFRFYLAAGNAIGHLAVLHAAERTFGIGIDIPAVGDVVHHVQRW